VDQFTSSPLAAKLYPMHLQREYAYMQQMRQWTTYRKPPTGGQMVTWSMTSGDPKWRQYNAMVKFVRLFTNNGFQRHRRPRRTPTIKQASIYT